VKETGDTSVYAELATLYERARRALDEAHRLAAEREFIMSWQRMRPHRYFRVTPASILDE
jgi:hypothetical protein